MTRAKFIDNKDWFVIWTSKPTFVKSVVISGDLIKI